ncbi:MAG: hypothetical protein V1799_06170 [bacterium]
MVRQLFILLLCTTLILESVYCCTVSSGITGRALQQKLGFIPFFINEGITRSESDSFARELESKIAAAGKYLIVSSNDAETELMKAKFPLQDIVSLHTIAEAGKILGVDRVLSGSLIRRGKLFTLSLRIVETSSAEVVFNKSWEIVGEMNDLHQAVNEIADDINTFDQGILKRMKWFVVAAVVVVVGVTVYLIAKSIFSDDKSVLFEPDNSQPGGGSGN